MGASNILVVGANGFLGSRTVAALVGAGHAVHAFGPQPVVDLLAPWREQIVEHEGSVTDGEATAAALATTRPDVVLCFAAHGEGREGLMRSGELAADRALAVNVGGLRTLLAACAQAGVRRVVWASSTTVFGPAAEYAAERVDETDRRAPRSFYGLTKVLAEEVGLFYRRRSGIEVCAVRPPLVFGPGRWYGGAAGALDTLLGAAARHEPVALTVPAEPFDLMYGEDVAAAFVHLVRHTGPLAECYHVNGFATSFREIAELLSRDCAGFRAALEYAPATMVYPLISAARVERETGFRPKFDLRHAVSHMLREMIS